MDEKRKFSRILFAARAHLMQANNIWSTTILDLSLNGVLVEEPANFTGTDMPIILKFSLPGSDVEVQMEAKQIHQKNNCLGLKCLHIDIDSISHLRRVIELNIGDSSLLNRELELFIEDHDQLKPSNLTP